LGDPEGRRIAGFRVVMSWPGGLTPPPPKPPRPPRHPGPGGLRARVAGMAGALLIVGGAAAVGVAVAAQQHAPQPSLTAAGATGPGGKAWWLSLRHSVPVSIGIPAIGVHSVLLHLGVRPDGTMQVPPLQRRPSAAGWYKHSVTPGQIGTSVIEGHVDNQQGPAVFYRLGALRPGDLVNVQLADGITAVFRVTGVRQYLKSQFPARTVYRDATRFAALRLITCGGAFDYATSQYLSSTVVFAFLVASHPAGHGKAVT
jgi:hypothetical protein